MQNPLINLEEDVTNAAHAKDMLIAVLNVLRRHDIPFKEVYSNIEKQPIIKQNRSSGELIKKARTYIDRNFHDPGLSAKTVCNHLHISTAYFSCVFKQYTGITFISYLTDTRIRKAAELLTDINQKAGMVAYSVGYGDPYYFTRVFKKVYGMPPSKYKELMNA